MKRNGLESHLHWPVLAIEMLLLLLLLVLTPLPGGFEHTNMLMHM